MSMKSRGAVLVMLGLCACEVPPRPEAPDGPPGDAAAPAPVSGWKLSTDQSGVSLALERDGTPVARFACLNDGRVFQAQGFALNPIGSEERLTIGAGDEAHALVADPDAPVTGVQGAGSIPPALLEAIEAGGLLSLSYGAQTLGPLESLGRVDQTAFVSGCRTILAG